MSISINDQISPKMRRLLKLMQNKRPVLEAAGAALEGMAIQSFRDASIRPSDWEGLADSTLKAKGGKGNLLIDSGALLHSIGHKSSGSQVEIGTDRFYAPFLQHGTSRMVARPFIPVSESGELSPKAAAAVKDAIEVVIERSFK